MFSFSAKIQRYTYVQGGVCFYDQQRVDFKVRNPFCTRVITDPDPVDADPEGDIGPGAATCGALPRTPPRKRKAEPAVVSPPKRSIRTTEEEAEATAEDADASEADS